MCQGLAIGFMTLVGNVLLKLPLLCILHYLFTYLLSEGWMKDEFDKESLNLFMCYFLTAMTIFVLTLPINEMIGFYKCSLFCVLFYLFLYYTVKTYWLERKGDFAAVGIAFQCVIVAFIPLMLQMRNFNMLGFLVLLLGCTLPLLDRSHQIDRQLKDQSYDYVVEFFNSLNITS